MEQLSLKVRMRGDWAVVQLPRGLGSPGLRDRLSQMAYAVPLLPPQTVGVLLLTEKAYQQWVACIDVTDRRLRIPILSRGQARLRREKLSLPRLLALYAGICDTALLTWGDDGRLTLRGTSRR